jgi:peptidoglycan/xylan/chitin deacetylase (PgdA/CDA1 family)
LAYITDRFVCWANGRLDGLAARVVPQRDVYALLHRAFPERSYSLEELAKRKRFPIYRAGNLNSADGTQMLRDASADLGIVLGTPMLSHSTFSVPRLGCISLHNGKVPEFRGTPPAFWELYEGCATAGLTVHFLDNGVNTGDVIATREIAIHEHETEQSLRRKLDLAGPSLLAECVAQIQAGTAPRVPQPAYSGKARTKPIRKQRNELSQRLPRFPEAELNLKQLLKTSLYLCIYCCGIFSGIRMLRKRFSGSRAYILLYHRVNDYSLDKLTTTTIRFAEHLCVLQKYYRVHETEWLVESLNKRIPIPNDTVLIHFDDCYADVLCEGGRILSACEMPATAFISSGYVGTDRVFDHDAQKYPFHFPNLTAEDVRRMSEFGFEVGAHTVNHPNLGELALEAAHSEVVDSRLQLERLLGKEVRYFSFPFGAANAIRDEVVSIVKATGYDAMFSAHGGIVHGDTDLFDIPRNGANSLYRPLDLMMEIEGLSLPELVRRLRTLLPVKRKPNPLGRTTVAQSAAS